MHDAQCFKLKSTEGEGEPVGPVGNATLVLIFPSRSEDQATAPDGCSTLSYFALITAGGDISRRRGGLRVVYI